MTACAPPTRVTPGKEKDEQGGQRRLYLETSAFALMVSSVVTALLGLVFWAVAARWYPAAEVGRASATITSATLLGTISNLSLGSMYERFLGLTRSRTVPLIVQGQVLCGSLAAVLGGLFLLLGPREKLFHTGLELVSFPLLVVALSMFALHDPMLVGLRTAPLVAVKNIFHAAAKLGLVIALAFTATGEAIVWAWMVPALVTGAVINVWLLSRVRRTRRLSGDPILPPRRELFQFFGASYTLTVMMSVVPLALPLIVVYRFGTETNAYFATSWTLASAAVVLITTVSGPYVAEAGSHPDPVHLPRLTRRFFRLLLAIGVGGGGALFVAAPYLLSIFGPAYAREGTDVTQLMALSLPFVAISTMYAALARVFRRLWLVVAVQPLTILGVLGGGLFLSDRMGLAGIGAAYLASEATCAVIISFSLVRMYRRAVGRTPALTT